MSSKIIIFIILLLAALVVAYIPIIHLPFVWMETYFHELSHGLAALLTGGQISHIELKFDGSGTCFTRGGWAFLVTFSGYSGAVIWGCTLYMMASELSPKVAYWLTNMMATSISITALLWVRDLVSFIIIGFIVGVFIVAFKLRHYSYILPLLLQFSGMYVLLNAIRSPLYLLDGRHIGDGATLATMTGIPEVFWIIIWCGFAISGLVVLVVYSRPQFLRSQRFPL